MEKGIGDHVSLADNCDKTWQVRNYKWHYLIEMSPYIVQWNIIPRYFETRNMLPETTLIALNHLSCFLPYQPCCRQSESINPTSESGQEKPQIHFTMSYSCSSGWNLFSKPFIHGRMASMTFPSEGPSLSNSTLFNRSALGAESWVMMEVISSRVHQSYCTVTRIRHQ